MITRVYYVDFELLTGTIFSVFYFTANAMTLGICLQKERTMFTGSYEDSSHMNKLHTYYNSMIRTKTVSTLTRSQYTMLFYMGILFVK